MGLHRVCLGHSTAWVSPLLGVCHTLSAVSNKLPILVVLLLPVLLLRLLGMLCLLGLLHVLRLLRLLHLLCSWLRCSLWAALIIPPGSSTHSLC